VVRPEAYLSSVTCPGVVLSLCPVDERAISYPRTVRAILTLYHNIMRSAELFGEGEDDIRG